jgi:phosphoglycolate phosphatase
MPGPRLDALIFDLDGTLADSIGDIGEATNRVLADHGLPGHTAEAYKQFVGEGAEVLVRRAFTASAGGDWRVATDGPFPAAVPDLVEAYRLAYDAVGHRHSRPYPEIDAMLDGVVARGRRLAVLSNKRDDFTKQLIQAQFGRWPFVDVRGEREGVPRKPDPIAAIELALVLNALPERIGFVGDTPIDMRTARNASMVPIGVTWGFRTEQELRDAGAKVLLHRPLELLALLTN